MLSLAPSSTIQTALNRHPRGFLRGASPLSNFLGTFCLHKKYPRVSRDRRSLLTLPGAGGPLDFVGEESACHKGFGGSAPEPLERSFQ